ncbi:MULTISPECIES: hypothetical protein [Paenibacillus]|uniref:hypothetical protein n=1 Tax=Paenibacillus TaxID=44249 RepID=UPI00096E3397|nr:hypothetical protein [Paenibacillus sp. FSL H8-0259]OMF24307.1 hypothetical protein BK132_24575 [Paenibacillus sp. FSL H8-0259]
MEKKDDTEIISDDEMMNLLHAAKKRDKEATLKLVDLYKEDIQRISRYIYLPTEDVVSMIIVEFLEILYK